MALVVAISCSAQRHPAEGIVGPRQDDSAPTPVAPSVAAPIPTEPAPRVAITFDDLGSTAESSEPALSRRILSSLTAQQAPVAVFVNCRNLQTEALQLWQRAGATVGNHTASHLSVDAAGPDEPWWNDVRSCDERLRGELGEPVRFFRFPYLRYGETPDFHARARVKLASLGYSVAHVTAATSEWLLAGYYDEARERGDFALSDELASAYVEHMVQSLDAAREIALRKTGQDVAHITLAHVNRLSADHIGGVLGALRARGWRFVALEEALADPVYARRDAYVGGCGCSWLARIEPPLTRNDTYVFGDYEDRLRERFEARVKALPR